MLDTYSGRPYWTGVQDLIAVRLNDIVKFHLVDKPHANVANVSGRSGELNKYSEAPGNPGTALRNNVIFFEERLWSAANPNPGVGQCNSTTLADAQNIGRTNQSIFFCTNTIQAGMAQTGLTSGSLPNVLAVIVAHEIGHRLNLTHHWRDSTDSGVRHPSPVSGIGSSQYALDSTDPSVFC